MKKNNAALLLSIVGRLKETCGNRREHYEMVAAPGIGLAFRDALWEMGVDVIFEGGVWKIRTPMEGYFPLRLVQGMPKGSFIFQPLK